MSEKDLVVKSNKLNSAFQSLSLAELHILQLAIIDARETGQGLSSDRPLRIDALRYADAFGTTRQNAYLRLKSAEDTLFKRQFGHLDDDGFWVKSRWISQSKYLKDQGAIEVVLTPAVVNAITRIDGVKEFFTQYLLSQIAGLDSVYSARLYELLIQWKSTGKPPTFELFAFREQLGLGVNEYKLMSNFKARVLEPAIDEINKKTDLTVSYEQQKNGRSITGFSFKFKQKQRKVEEKQQQRDADTVDMFCKLSDNQVKMYSSILSKSHSISDLAGTKDYPAFAIWIANILRDPKSVRQETAQRIFTTLRTETDYVDVER